MKRLLFIGIVFLTGCYEHIPYSVRAQMIAEDYLDTLYTPAKVEEKTGISYITIRDYLDPSKQKVFQMGDISYRQSAGRWSIFTEKIKSILSKEQGGINGNINIERFKVNGVRYTAAVIVDASLSKVLKMIPINKLVARKDSI